MLGWLLLKKTKKIIHVGEDVLRNQNAVHHWWECKTGQATRVLFPLRCRSRRINRGIQRDTAHPCSKQCDAQQSNGREASVDGWMDGCGLYTQGTLFILELEAILTQATAW